MNFSPDRLKAVALMAEVGLPLYKIHHSIVIGDVALLIADGVEKLEGVKVDRYVCEMGALLLPLMQPLLIDLMKSSKNNSNHN